MSKLKTLATSAIIGLSPLTGSQTAMAQTPQQQNNQKTEISVPQKDKFAKFREAEKHALPLLVFFEGCSLKAYHDCVKVPTIGIGNTTFPDGRRVTIKDHLNSNSEMYSMVAAYLEKHVYPHVDKYITRQLSPEEMSAVLSLCYNCGAGILSQNGQQSTIAKRINQGTLESMSKAFLSKSYTQKGFNNGLAVRRCMELEYAFKALSFEDFQDFYVCSYDRLNYKDLTAYKKTSTFQGRVVKTDIATTDLIKDTCREAPDDETAKKREWFGGNRKVSDFTAEADSLPKPQLQITPQMIAMAVRGR